MEDTLDYGTLSAFGRAQQHDRIRHTVPDPSRHVARTLAPSPSKQQAAGAPPSPTHETEEDEQAEIDQEQTLFQNIVNLEVRGKKLKDAAIRDQAQAEVLGITNEFVDMSAVSIIEIGKATLEILIGFLLLPAGFILKILKFGTDRSITELKISSQKKDEQGDKLLAQAAKLRGVKTPFKRTAGAVLNPIKNYFSELMGELFPLGISPSLLLTTVEEKKKIFHKILLRSAVFFTAIAATIALLVLFIILVFQATCNQNLLTKAFCETVKIFGFSVIQ